MRTDRLGLPWLAAAALTSVLLAGCGAGQARGQTVVLYGFSIMEDVMREEVVPAFQRAWMEETGDEVEVITSFAGSGTITNQIVFGAPAQVAIVATEMDALSIHRAGRSAGEWRDYPNQGTFAYTVACIVTRKGNPKGLESFVLPPEEDVEVVYPDPTTSGGAQWAILAVYGSALMTSEVATGRQDDEMARSLLREVSLRTGSLPESAKRALTQFGLGYGDILITYENEALLENSRGNENHIIIPESTIYVEPKVVVIDGNVDDEQRPVVSALVEFLWSPEAQDAFARHNFRVWDESVMARSSEKYKTVRYPFDVEYFGGWETATSEIIYKTWRDAQRGSH